jgi:hypothetical protein
MVSSFFSRLDGDEDLPQSPVGVEVHGTRGRGVEWREENIHTTGS